MKQTELKGLLRRGEIKAADLARELDIAPSTLSLKLSGQRPLRLDEVLSICRLLNRPDVLRRLRRRRPLTIEDILGQRGAA